MRRRSILKWIALTAISLALVFMISTIVRDSIVSAANNKSGPATQGSLRVLDQDGKAIGECPLKHTTVKAEVSGFVSRVTVTQDFENNLPNKIEAVYTFPLPAAAAVDDLTMLIGERTIKGKVMRREDAQNAYAAAKQVAKIATLLDQERPNIFTQQVANILPGQQIRVTISYVETLKYEDGSYEWSFPMVVGQRYVPASDPPQQPTADANVSDASLITPLSARDGMRAGHDISIEIDLDAGVPIVGFNSATHEIEVQQTEKGRAVLQLKDRATIPNKDFVLSYQVAGDSINDAVLAHRSERGGFFTLILQPPLRVAPEDVMPKELVFVLDTSGSMEGFPIEQAKQTMQLAFDTLNPHDTFNLITFSGDTEILFREPVPATPENVKKAKKFLSSRKGEGGTEMMKAIKAALDPSDAQYHVRLACFMTDGQVGNDDEILAEVQRHPNARVFAMGFGSAPNRSLLDKMSAYGRGQVTYISGEDDKTPVARRFNERIRNPLLTDLSIDWSNLPVTDVSPKQLPDLFSARPLIISGRYSSGAKGTIKLRGKMAGQDFVREIPVELPDVEEDHDVLGTVWARGRIEELMAEQLGSKDQVASDQKRDEITELGLKFKLMTQYTSFVAIDDVVFTGTDPAQRVEVPIESSSTTVGGTVNYVTVMAAGATQCSVGTTTYGISTYAVQDLPIQGRSVLGLMTLTPGVAVNKPSAIPEGFFSANGQRPTSNELKLDGVSVLFGIAPGGENPGASASGNMPALTASGGANNFAAFGSTREVTTKTTALEPEYGRVAGAQVEVTTRAGTNNYHGSVFHFFGNDAFDANDWFANSRGLTQPAKRLNSFGGTFGGPIRRDHTFFFASYEGMRLRQPMVGITDVPSLGSRVAAPAATRSVLDAFPLPNGPTRTDGFAEFAASFANPARHDVGMFSLDHVVSDKMQLRGRYTFGDSDAAQRGPAGFSLNTTNHIHTHSQSVTGGLTYMLTSTILFDLRANYSRSRASGSYFLDDFGGAAVPAGPFPAASVVFDLNSRNAGWMVGDEQANLQRQINLNGSLLVIKGQHNLRFGGDYRRLSPAIALRASEQNAFFDGVSQAITGVATRVSRLSFGDRQNPVFQSLSLFGQDEWKPSTRFTFTYGARWELAPPPSTDEQALAVDQVSDPATLKLATPGSSLWKTTFGNVAPRASFAYQILDPNKSNELLLRGGVGILYDLGQDRSGDIFASSIPFVSTNSGSPLMAFDPRLKLPYIVTWNASLQRALGNSQAISIAYLASSGKRLLHTETLLDQNPSFSFLRLMTNRGNSDYHALQARFNRSLRDGFTANFSYTWAQSLDNFTGDSARRVFMTSLNPEADRGASDFDARHQLKGYLSYEIPAPVARGIGNKLTRNWAIDSIFNARSARPLNVVYVVPTVFGVAYLRPDLVSGATAFIEDPLLAGGRKLNSPAFLIPANLEQGNLARNSLRAFPFYQLDMSLRRRFHFTEDVSLQIQADAFNVLNHANFEDPLGNDLVVKGSTAFGESTAMSGRSLVGGGFPSFYNVGGPRTMRFSVKFVF